MTSHELSAEAQHLLAAERNLSRMPDELRARAFARARAALRAADTSPAGFFRQRSVLLAAALVIAFAAVSFAALQAKRSAPEPASGTAPPAAPVNPRAIAAAPSPSPPVTAEASSEQVSPVDASPAPKDAAVTVPRTAPSVDSYALELATLQRARTALSAGDFSAALSALTEHQRRFPAGRLAEEREALRVKALLGLGQTDEARRTAERFRARFPRSVLLPRIEETTRR